jgi:hypothetical protein
MAEHELKLDTRFWMDTMSGIKPFELRFNDRGYKIGDTLRLKEWLPNLGVFTGESLIVTVSYILHDFDGLEPDYVILGTKIAARDVGSRRYVISRNPPIEVTI